MTKLIYATNMSLDGYIEDQHGEFALWPHDDEVFAAHTNLIRSARTFLYGRWLYESMALWETDPALAAQSELTADFAAAWQSADKVVYSTTLTTATTARTRIAPCIDIDAIRDMKASATNDLTVGGARLAAQLFAAGLIDECQIFLWPSIIGGGKAALPRGTRTNLDLVDERRFGNGVVLLRYRMAR